MSRSEYRSFVPPPEKSKVRGDTAREHAEVVLKVPLIQNILAGWQEMFVEPFKGITTDGEIIPALFERRSEQAPTEQAIIAAHHLLSELTPLTSVYGVGWHSLQLGRETGQIADSEWASVIQDGSDQLTDFAATAAVMAELDLIICVDSAVAHLAGALGKPVWVLLSFAPDWRWGWEGETSAWYPSARLFRQGYGETWTSLGERMAAALRPLVG